MGILDEDFIGVVGKGKLSTSGIPGGFVASEYGQHNDFVMFPAGPVQAPASVEVEPNMDRTSQQLNVKTQRAGLKAGETAINPPVTSTE